jgi:hypothetical protein
MRRKMCKPANMKIRIFVNHLHQINFNELPQLPPFKADQELSNNKLLDINLFGIPKSWVKEMDKQDFNPFAREDIQALIQFCKRMESAEDFHDNSNKQGSNSKNSYKKTKFSNNKGKPTKGNGKWCEYHDTDTHKESRRNNSSDKKPFNKNNTWTKKSDIAKGTKGSPSLSGYIAA